MVSTIIPHHHHPGGGREPSTCSLSGHGSGARCQEPWLFSIFHVGNLWKSMDNHQIYDIWWICFWYIHRSQGPKPWKIHPWGYFGVPHHTSGVPRRKRRTRLWSFLAPARELRKSWRQSYRSSMGIPYHVYIIHMYRLLARRPSNLFSNIYCM